MIKQNNKKRGRFFYVFLLILLMPKILLASQTTDIESIISEISRLSISFDGLDEEYNFDVQANQLSNGNEEEEGLSAGQDAYVKYFSEYLKEVIGSDLRETAHRGKLDEVTEHFQEALSTEGDEGNIGVIKFVIYNSILGLQYKSKKKKERYSRQRKMNLDHNNIHTPRGFVGGLSRELMDTLIDDGDENYDFLRSDSNSSLKKIRKIAIKDAKAIEEILTEYLLNDMTSNNLVSKLRTEHPEKFK